MATPTPQRPVPSSEERINSFAWRSHVSRGQAPNRRLIGRSAGRGGAGGAALGIYALSGGRGQRTFRSCGLEAGRSAAGAPWDCCPIGPPRLPGVLPGQGAGLPEVAGRRLQLLVSAADGKERADLWERRGAAVGTTGPRTPVDLRTRRRQKHRLRSGGAGRPLALGSHHVAGLHRDSPPGH